MAASRGHAPPPPLCCRAIAADADADRMPGTSDRRSLAGPRPLRGGRPLGPPGAAAAKGFATNAGEALMGTETNSSPCRCGCSGGCRPGQCGGGGGAALGAMLMCWL